MNEQTIQINGKDIVIKKIPLKKYAELIAAFQELPKYFKDFSGKSQDEIVTMLPMLIGSCYPDVSRVFQVATNLPGEEIDEMGLEDAVRIVLAIMDTNNFGYVYETIKKMIAQRTIKQPEAIEAPKQ